MLLLFLSCVLAGLIAFSGAALARDLKVCADPKNPPFSKADGSGFENKIAALIADDLAASLSYAWAAQRRGFLRETLNAGRCDLVMGAPSSLKALTRTKPYYRASYAFVQRNGEPKVASFDDPVLRTLRIGVQLVGDDGSNTPPVHDLARRGIVENVRGFMIYGDASRADPAEPVVAAVANGEIDVAVVWGPVAGYYAARQSPKLAVTPVLFDPAHLDLPMTYDISIGVRKGDFALMSELNGALDRLRFRIEAILNAYGLPRPGHVLAKGEDP